MVDPSLRTVLAELSRGLRKWPLLLQGDVGTGKTLAALCLCDWVRRASYYTIERACSIVMGDDRDELVFWDRIASDDLIVIDELGGREKVGDLHYSTLKQILDTREAEGEKRAIYITNLTIERLTELYDDRVCSRLCFGSRFELTGIDRRSVMQGGLFLK